METKVYDKAVEGLVDKISYGSLGVLDTLAQQSNESSTTKRNVMLLNIATVVRNIINQKIDEKHFLQAVDFEISQYRQFFNNYAPEKSHCVFYYQSDVYDCIPEHARRTMTATRELMLKYALKVVQNEGLRMNICSNLGKQDNVNYWGIWMTKKFAFHHLRDLMRDISFVPKIWMVSHCPIDYFLSDVLPVSIIDSHTGKVTEKKDLGMKVFKDPDIPFNRTTLKLFGDKEFIAPLVRRTVLKGIKLKLHHEREIVHLAKIKFKVDPKQLDWKM